MSPRFFTFAERPDLRERGHLRAAWPPFMLESPISNERWHLLYERFPGFQFWLVDGETGDVLLEGNTLPVRLDVADLPDRGGSTSSSTRPPTTPKHRHSCRRSRSWSIPLVTAAA